MDTIREVLCPSRAFQLWLDGRWTPYLLLLTGGSIPGNEPFPAAWSRQMLYVAVNVVPSRFPYPLRMLAC